MHLHMPPDHSIVYGRDEWCFFPPVQMCVRDGFWGVEREWGLVCKPDARLGRSEESYAVEESV